VLPGEATIEVGVLRRGNGLSNLEAKLVRGGEVLARASAVLARARGVEAGAGGASLAAGAPRGPGSWSEVAVAPVGPPFGPAFAPHYEYRSTGPLPFSAAGGAAEGAGGGAVEPVAEGWVRLRRAVPLDAPAIVGLLDAWWPAALPTFRQPRPIATVGFTMQLLTEPSALPPDEPLFHRARLVASDEGYMVEFRELWTASGLLVAMNQQTFAIIK
jgi:hypothetical protein